MTREAFNSKASELLQTLQTREKYLKYLTNCEQVLMKKSPKAKQPPPLL